MTLNQYKTLVFAAQFPLLPKATAKTVERMFAWIKWGDRK